MFIKSKIQFFESKSQRTWARQWQSTRCLSSQRYNFLKANHNIESIAEETPSVVYQVKDTIFWKQITTRRTVKIRQQWLFIKSKIQFFESKSQPYICALCLSKCCLSSQRYNFLKANHNPPTTIPVSETVVYQVKDTIFWKQITTTPERMTNVNSLFIKSKIQFFESKSQLFFRLIDKDRGCLSSQRYNFLKANHNSWSKVIASLKVVYQVKDTIFWKQITTA